MIAKGDQIDTRFDQPFVLPGHQTRTIGCVLGIHDQGIDLMFFAKRLGMLHNTGIARLTDQITKKENTHEKLSLPDRYGNLIRDGRR